jgi:large subunit ribosomal protein L4
MAYNVTVYNMNGASTSTKDMDASVFNLENVNPTLLQEYLVMHLANQRVSIAHTKTRWEVQGSGRKLYRQKGTGSARVGDARSPIRKKGWVVFGPRNTDVYAKEMPKKMRNRALLSALVLQLSEGVVYGLDAFTSDTIKTKVAVQTLQKLPCALEKTLVIMDSEQEILKKSLRNIDHVQFTSTSRLNAYDVMNAKHILCIWSSLDMIEQQFTA